MTTRTRSWTAISAAVLSFGFMASQYANAQSQQALSLTLLKTSIQTQDDTLSLISNEFQQAFLPAAATCPNITFAKNGCTLRIEVSCVFEDTWFSGSETINVTVMGASLPPVDPAAAIPMDGVAPNNPNLDAHTFHWMQRSIPAGATVTVGKHRRLLTFTVSTLHPNETGPASASGSAHPPPSCHTNRARFASLPGSQSAA